MAYLFDTDAISEVLRPQPLPATAIHHDLDLVTGNLRHFARVPGLRITPALAAARGGRLESP